MEIDRFLYGFLMGTIIGMAFHQEWISLGFFMISAVLMVIVDYYGIKWSKEKK